MVQLQLWKSESGRKACSGILRRGLPQLVWWQLHSCDVPRPPASPFRRQGRACKGDMRAADLRSWETQPAEHISQPRCLQSSRQQGRSVKYTFASCVYTWGGRSWAT